MAKVSLIIPTFERPRQFLAQAVTEVTAHSDRLSQRIKRDAGVSAIVSSHDVRVSAHDVAAADHERQRLF